MLLAIDGSTSTLVVAFERNAPPTALVPLVRDNAATMLHHAEVITLPSGAGRLQITSFDQHRAERRIATIVRIRGEAPLVGPFGEPKPITLPNHLMPLRFALRTSLH